MCKFAQIYTWTISLFLISACLQPEPLSSPGGGGIQPPPLSSTAVIDWARADADLFGSGKGEFTSSTFMDNLGTGAYCFENDLRGFLDPCRRAHRTSVTNVVGNLPVAIRGFQLNFARHAFSGGAEYESVVIDGAWVSTAELQFDISTGELRLVGHQQTSVHPGSCNIEDVNMDPGGFTVGYQSDDRILTALFLSDEYDFSAPNNYTSGNIKAARVHYSGIVASEEPVSAPGSCGPYCWSFVPNDDNAVTTDFGVAAFSQTNTVNVLTSNYFGVTSGTGVNNWNKRVVTGFCINGYKQKEDEDRRPLLHHVRVRTHEPRLLRK
jgi:hypothetical protein